MLIYLDLFVTFFKIGLFTFGGGYAMLPLIQAEVINHGWLEMSEVVDFIAISESTPGPFAINMATFVGSQTGGVFGAFCSTLGVVLPSFIVILIVARIYDAFRKNRIVSGCMYGLKSAVVGLIAKAMLSILLTAFFPQGVSLEALSSPAFFVSLAIFILSAILTFSKRKVHPIVIILISALAGVVCGIGFGL